MIVAIVLAALVRDSANSIVYTCKHAVYISKIIVVCKYFKSIYPTHRIFILIKRSTLVSKTLCNLHGVIADSHPFSSIIINDL